MVTGDGSVIVDRAYRKHASDIRRAVTRILRTFAARSSDDLEEIVQIVFLRLLELHRSGKYAEDMALGGYLVAIARNETWDVLASRKRETMVPEVSDVMVGTRAAEFEDNVEIATLQAYLATLPVTLKQVFTLRFVEGFSQSQACAAIGISRQSLRTLEERIKDGGIRAIADMARARRTTSARAAGEPPADPHADSLDAPAAPAPRP